MFESMGNMLGMMAKCESATNRGYEGKVFDWDSAAKFLKENGIKNAWAGLAEDWSYTAGRILEDGEIPESSYTFLSSLWATPVIEYQLPGENGDLTEQECMFVEQADSEWDSGTFWPESARKIYFGE